MAKLFRVIASLEGQGMTIFLVEQNANAALVIADRGYIIETGRTAMSGPGCDLLESDQLKAAYLGI